MIENRGVAFEQTLKKRPNLNRDELVQFSRPNSATAASAAGSPGRSQLTERDVS
jgi:hypothetical protein